MPREIKPDICVIGAGSAGLTVAAAAAAFGVPVVLVERHRMGGDCLNTGCVPSKALIAAAKHVAAIREARAFGIDAGEPVIDFARVSAHVHAVIKAIEPNDSEERFRGLGVTVLRGQARFLDDRTVRVGDEAIVRARRFVIATGSTAAVPPIPGLDTVPYLTNESVFDLAALPRRLIVIGAGPIGLELGQAHRRLGSEVVVLEGAKAFARDDADTAAIVRASLARDGVEIREGVKVLRVEARPDGLRCIVAAGDDGAEENVDGTHLLVAAGRKPTLDGLDLDKAGIVTEKAGITTDPGLRTSNRRVYAIGDCAAVVGVPAMRLTHVAGYHAGLVVRSALFRLPVSVNPDILPWVTFTDPEIGQVGLDETMARARFGDKVKVVAWPYRENDRAQAERETEGLVKLVVHPRGRIVGAMAAGRHAGELINTFSLAVKQGLKVGAFAGYVSPYPTLSEVGRRAAIDWYKPSLTAPAVRRIIALLRNFG
jgi:pyruvate/2-oxoglutarate dehydrogenase complex dihydrolipoamide dehydrogenase (E3) component